MKKLGHALLLSFLIACSSGVIARAVDAEAVPIGDKWAVVVGVSKHADPNVVASPFAAKNASDFASFLIDSEHFAPDHVRLLLDEKATREAILKEIGSKFLPYAAMPNDLVVVYIAGPGSPANWDVHGTSYLLPYDVDLKTLYSTGMSLSSLPKELSLRVHTNRVVVFTDVSYSNSAPAERLDFLNKLVKNCLLINACKGDEKAGESKTFKSGIFTHYLIEDLRKAGVDSTLSEAIKELPDQVASAAKKENSSEQHVTGIPETWAYDPKIGAAPTRPRSAPLVR